jgi:hypothetical protein
MATFAARIGGMVIFASTGTVGAQDVPLPKGSAYERAVAFVQNEPATSSARVRLEHCARGTCTSRTVLLGAGAEMKLEVLGVVDLEGGEVELARGLVTAAHVMTGALAVRTHALTTAGTAVDDVWLVSLRNPSNVVFHGTSSSRAFQRSFRLAYGKGSVLDIVSTGRYLSGALPPGSGLALPGTFHERWTLTEGSYVTADVPPPIRH